jgi:hypothetical protein
MRMVFPTEVDLRMTRHGRTLVTFVYRERFTGTDVKRRDIDRTVELMRTMRTSFAQDKVPLSVTTNDGWLIVTGKRVPRLMFATAMVAEFHAWIDAKWRVEVKRRIMMDAKALMKKRDRNRKSR